MAGVNPEATESPEAIFLDPTGEAFVFPLTPIDYLALAVQIVETIDPNEIMQNDQATALKDRIQKHLSGGIVQATAADLANLKAAA
jgi:hypothetical protein